MFIEEYTLWWNHRQLHVVQDCFNRQLNPKISHSLGVGFITAFTA